MLKPNLARIMIALPCAFAGFLFIAWQSGYHVEVCDQAKSNQDHCIAYNLASFILLRIDEILNDIAGIVTAAATIAIAAFTGTLYRVTSNQGHLTQQSIELTRQEFNATHRPKIIVRNFQIANPEIAIGSPVNFVFIAHNIGDSPGRVIEVRSATLFWKVEERIPDDFSFPFREEFDLKLESGQRELFPGNGGLPVGKGEFIEYYAGERMLLCLGTITYLDGSGTRRETAFCRSYHPLEHRWDTMMKTPYEYDY